MNSCSQTAAHDSLNTDVYLLNNPLTIKIPTETTDLGLKAT